MFSFKFLDLSPSSFPNYSTHYILSYIHPQTYPTSQIQLQNSSQTTSITQNGRSKVSQATASFALAPHHPSLTLTLSSATQQNLPRIPLAAPTSPSPTLSRVPRVRQARRQTRVRPSNPPYCTLADSEPQMLPRMTAHQLGPVPRLQRTPSVTRLRRSSTKDSRSMSPNPT